MTPIDKYNWWRRFRPETLVRRKSFHAVCYAPYVSLFFDPQGYVRSCCQSVTHSLGNVTKDSIEDIWQGEKIRRLRKALRQNQMPNGCATCKWEIVNHNFSQSFSRVYDLHRITSETMRWPKSMWFMLNNSCNLECVQCYGEVSSSIRRKRDGLKPLPRVYNDHFFDELRGFLPHLDMAVFLGGEAFLCPENYRIWDAIIRDNLKTECFIVTNGTVFNQKIQDIVQNLSCHISISLDGATKESIEAIRRNGNYETILGNIERFSSLAQSKNRQLELSFCVMPSNYHEFPDFLLLADNMHCRASVNTVYHPAEHSLCVLPEDELRAVYELWMSRDREMRSSLRSNRNVWRSEISRLANWLKRATELPEPMYLSPIGPRFRKQACSIGYRSSRDEDSGEDLLTYEMAKGLLLEWSNKAKICELVVDDNDRLVSLHEEYCGLPRDSRKPNNLSELLMRLREKLGPDVEVLSDEITPSSIDRIVRFTNIEQQSTELRWIAVKSIRVEQPLISVVASVRDAGIRASP